VRVGCATYLIGVLAILAAGTSWLAYQKTVMAGTRYVAVRGDTMSSIATNNAVDADMLRAWNWKVDDPVEPNQVLMVWPKGRPFIEDILDAVHIVQRRWAPQMMVVPLQATLASVKWRADGVQVGGKDADHPLQMPPPKKCAPRRVIEPIRPGDLDRARAGLTNDQINASIEAFLPYAVKCLDGARNPGTIRLDMMVVCDGRVAKVQQVGNSGYPTDIVDCITGVLRYTPFPPHDDEEGDRFEYVLELKPDLL
jgi:LysM repeat protein